MRVLTFKAKPSAIFGFVIAIIGIVIILASFMGNHNGVAESNAPKKISCATAEERLEYLNSLGWQVEKSEEMKEITIPQKFNAVYNQYNDIQAEQGFDLENYKGKKAVVYTYKVTNYEDNDNVIADLIVCDGILIGADLCDTNAENGFLVALAENGKQNGKN